MNQANIQQKILATLYGQAIGDAMGMPSELWTQKQVRNYFGKIETFLPGPAENIAASTFVKGEYTDDTQQAIALLNAIIECNGDINPDVIAKHILKWTEENNIFEKNILGPSSKSALLEIKQGVPINKIFANGITNGSVMRISPVGCLLPTHDLTKFIRDVAASCSITHKSDIAIAGSVVIAWAISMAIEGISWKQIKSQLPHLASQVQTTYESTFSPSLARRIEWAFDIAKRVKGQDENYILSEIYQTVGAGMDVIETVPCALALIDICDYQPMHVAKLCANLGGDTDTIGAIATAVCGALTGISAFDAKDISLINQVNRCNFLDASVQLAKLRQVRGL